MTGGACAWLAQSEEGAWQPGYLTAHAGLLGKGAEDRTSRVVISLDLFSGCAMLWLACPPLSSITT